MGVLDHGHRWPDGARCVVAVTFDWDGTCIEVGHDQAPVGNRSHGRYAAKRGIPRFLEIFRRQGIATTCYIPGYDAEVSPDLVRQIATAGHEVASHGYLHEGTDLGDTEPALLEKTHAILTDVTGEAPKGWRSPSGQKSVLTVRTLKRLGYIYDSSDKDHDYPYLGRVEGEDVEGYMFLPNNTSSLDDFAFTRTSYTPPSEILRHWKQEFDAIWAEQGYFNLTVHPRCGYGSGSPARARLLDELVTYIKGFDGVVFLRMIDLAQWCLENPDEWRLPRGGGHV